MTEAPQDFAATHRHFASTCFNQVWTLLDKTNRTADEDQQMLLLAFASLYHWTQRPECSNQQLSVGYWQISRVHVVLNLADEGLRYASLCSSLSQDLSPFYRGYAWEAVARAAAKAGKIPQARHAYDEATGLLVQIADSEERHLLAQDLASIALPGS